VSQKLKNTIDRMVEESIRKILPQVMNEVLLKTIAGANVIQERVDKPAYPYLPPAGTPQKKIKVVNRPKSLNSLLDPGVGADFYEREEATTPKAPVQRIQNLPPQFQKLAEGMEVDDDGEMWDSELGDSGIPSAGQGPSINEGVRAIGLDFSKMKQAINITEKKNPGPDAAAKAQFEETRIKAMRDRLDKMA
jgi:hypothetical protein